jgi:hypothetical protein
VDVDVDVDDDVSAELVVLELDDEVGPPLEDELEDDDEAEDEAELLVVVLELPIVGNGEGQVSTSFTICARGGSNPLGTGIFDTGVLGAT